MQACYLWRMVGFLYWKVFVMSDCLVSSSMTSRLYSQQLTKSNHGTHHWICLLNKNHWHICDSFQPSGGCPQEKQLYQHILCENIVLTHCSLTICGIFWECNPCEQWGYAVFTTMEISNHIHTSFFDIFVKQCVIWVWWKRLTLLVRILNIWMCVKVCSRY